MERGYTMKKKKSFRLRLPLLCFCACHALYAATINLSTEIDGILNYYTSQTTAIENWNEIIAFSSVNAIKVLRLRNRRSTKTPPITLAQFILSRLALWYKPERNVFRGDPVAKLASKQKEDGSFYENDLYGTVLFARLHFKAHRQKRGDETVVYSAKQATS